MNALLNILLISVVFLSTVETVRSYKFYRFGKRFDKDGQSFDLIDQSLIYRGNPDNITDYELSDFMICAYVKRRKYTGRIAEITIEPSEDDSEEIEEKILMALGMNEDFMYLLVGDDLVRLYLVPSFSSWFSLCGYFSVADTAYMGIMAKVGNGTIKSKHSTFDENRVSIPLTKKLEIGREFEGFIGNFVMGETPGRFYHNPELSVQQWGECKWSWETHYTFDDEGWIRTNMPPPCDSNNCNIWEGSTPGFITCTCAQHLYGDFP